MSISQLNFNKILAKEYLFEKIPYIAVAVSGGPDSMALVFLLDKWVSKQKGKLIALIVDHHIRKESKREAQITKYYLAQNNIKSIILRVPNKNIKKKTMDKARQNRFTKILKFCNQNNIFHLFLGHHYDDNLETFLLRKIAGSNYEGLISMQTKVTRDKVQILRPLLQYSKKEILEFNYLNKIKYVNDPSNKNKIYSRVIVRKFIEDNNKYKREIEKDFRLIQGLSSSYKRMIFQIFHQVNILINKNKVIINFNKFLNLDREIQIKIIEIIHKYLYAERPFLRYAKISRVLEYLSKKNKFHTNLAGMKIYRDSFFISFKA